MLKEIDEYNHCILYSYRVTGLIKARNQTEALAKLHDHLELISEDVVVEKVI